MIVQELFSLLGLKIDEKSWAKGDAFLSAVKTGFAALVAGFGLAQVQEMIAGVADLADAATKTASKLGITAEAVQELNYAAKLSNIESGQFEKGLLKLGKGLDDIRRKGQGPAADALRSLGIKFSELKDEGLDANLERIAIAFQQMPDGPKKSAAAMALFGDELGGRMIPLLNGGQEGLVALREEAQRLGIVVSDEAAKRFEEFNDAQTRIAETWRGLKVQVVTALLPALVDLVDRLQSWISKNRELISQGLEAVIYLAAAAFRALAMAVEKTFEVIDWLRGGSDEAMAVLYALAAAITMAVVPALLQMAVAWVAAAAPVIAFGAVLAGIAYGIIKLVKHWDVVRDAVVGFFMKIPEYANAAVDVIVKVLAKLILWPVTLARLFIAAFQRIGSFISARWDQIKNGAARAFDFIKSVPGRVLDAYVAFGGAVVDAIGSAFDYIIQKAKDTARIVWEEIKDIPVIGHLASAAEYLAESPTQGDLVTAQQQLFGRDFVAPSGGGGTNLTASFSTQVTVNPSAGLDEEAVGNIAAQKAAEANNNMLSAAFAAARGGRR